jgi:hypothetical protein
MSEAALQRPRFFAGKLLTAHDLKLEQNYFRRKLQRHNRTLHGFGIVAGLEVAVNSNQIVIGEGLALDCEGNELVIETAQTLGLPAALESSTIAYVSIRYHELSREPSTAPGGEEPATIEEGFEIVFAEENSNRGHRHLRARWLVCGKPHPLTLAKLRRGGQAWRVDRRYRAPRVK